MIYPNEVLPKINWNNSLDVVPKHAYIAATGDSDIMGNGGDLVAVGAGATKDANGWNTLYNTAGHWRADGLEVSGRNITVLIVNRIDRMANSDVFWATLSSTDAMLSRQYNYNGDLRHRNVSSSTDIQVNVGDWSGANDVLTAKITRFSENVNECKIFESGVELPLELQEASSNTTQIQSLILGSLTGSTCPTQQVEAIFIFDELLTDEQCLTLSANPLLIAQTQELEREEYALTFNGTSQYVTIDPIILTVGESVTIGIVNFNGANGDDRYLTDGTGTRCYCFIDANDKITFNSAVIDVEIDGVLATSGTTSFPADGSNYTVKIIAKSDVNLDTFFARFGRDRDYFNATCKSVAINQAGNILWIFDQRSPTPTIADEYQGAIATLVGFPTYSGYIWENGEIVGYRNNTDTKFLLTSPSILGDFAFKMRFKDIDRSGTSAYPHFVAMKDGQQFYFDGAVNKCGGVIDGVSGFWTATISDDFSFVFVREGTSRTFYTIDHTNNDSIDMFKQFTGVASQASIATSWMLMNRDWSSQRACVANVTELKVSETIPADIVAFDVPLVMDLDYQSGDVDSLPDKVNSAHNASINIVPTSGFLPILDKQVFTIGAVNRDYVNVGTFEIDQGGSTGIREGRVYGRVIEPSTITFSSATNTPNLIISAGDTPFDGGNTDSCDALLFADGKSLVTHQKGLSIKGLLVDGNYATTSYGFIGGTSAVLDAELDINTCAIRNLGGLGIYTRSNGGLNLQLKNSKVFDCSRSGVRNSGSGIYNVTGCLIAENNTSNEATTHGGMRLGTNDTAVNNVFVGNGIAAMKLAIDGEDYNASDDDSLTGTNSLINVPITLDANGLIDTASQDILKGADWNGSDMGSAFYATGSSGNQTASITVNLPAFIASGNANFSSPGYLSSVNAQLPAFTATGAISFNGPGYSASINALLPAFNATGTISFNVPGYSASVNAQLPAFTATGTINFSDPQYQVNITVDLPAMVATGTIDFSAPGYGASLSANLPAFIASGNVMFNTPGYNSVITVSTPALKASATAYFGFADYLSNITVNLPAMSATGAVDFVTPGYSNNVNVQLPAFIASANLDISTPNYLGQINAFMPAFQASGVLDIENPMYTASITAMLPAIKAKVIYAAPESFAYGRYMFIDSAQTTITIDSHQQPLFIQ